MKQKITLILSLILFSGIAFAGHVSENTAQRVAKTFLQSRIAAADADNFGISEALPALHIGNGRTLIYAINFSRGGYVLVPATDASVPVLGYSFTGRFELENQPASLTSWIAGYEVQLQEIIENQLPATPEISSAWTGLLSDNPAVTTRDLRSAGPLLTSTWDQGSRYNGLCPEDPDGPGGRVYAGCVATAMSQVIYYWRYPLAGTGSHGYYSNYGYLFVDFSKETYDYYQMCNSIGPNFNYEMAKIQYHCGVAVDMGYSPTGSGAYSFNAAEALRQYFGFSNQMSYVDRYYYSDAQWAELLRDNIDSGKPMYYDGYGSGGHAFNLDGYQGDDYFHFNWGWSGSYNGYYYLDNLNPGGNNFSQWQGAIVNLFPANNYPYYCNGVDTLTYHRGTIEDGSGPVDNYIPGLNCGWLIAPADSVNSLSVTFEKFDLTDGVDVLNIYDGPDVSFPLLGSFTGNELPSKITASGDKLFVEFITAGDAGSGFRLAYESEVAVFCSGTTVYTDPEGIITDGSGSRNYSNNSMCKFRVEPEDATSITFSFNRLDTEPEKDIIRIYDLSTQKQVASFSGNVLPDPVTVSSGKAMILFSSDGDVTGTGWEIAYTAETTAVSVQSPGLNSGLHVQAKPNPANEWLRVDLKSALLTEVAVSLVDISGRTVKGAQTVSFSGQKTLMLQVNELSKGLYFLKYHSENGSGTVKVLISR